MPTFTFTGDQETVYPTLAAADGSTLVVKPGDSVTLDAAPDARFTTGKAKAAPETAPEAPQSPASPTSDPTPTETA